MNSIHLWVDKEWGVCFIQCVNYYINHRNAWYKLKYKLTINIICYCIMIQCLESTILIFIIEEVFFCWSVLNLWKVFMVINLLSWNLKRLKVILSSDMMHVCWYYLSFLYTIDWPENKSKVLKYVCAILATFFYAFERYFIRDNV